MDLSTMSIRELIIELAGTETAASGPPREEAIVRVATSQPDRVAYQHALMIELGRRRQLLGREPSRPTP